MKKLLSCIFVFLVLLCITSCGKREVTVEKTASCASDRTVHPGDTITYLFTVENPTGSRKKITIMDTIPQHTVFAGGDTICQNGKVEFEVTVRAKSTECVSYTVEVLSDEDLLGLPIVSDAARAEDTPLSCETLYIGRTLSKGDREKFSLSVSAMLDSEMKGKELFRFLYYVAFSKAPPISEEASGVLNHLFLDRRADETKTYTSMVVPGLYGGKKLSENMESLFFGLREESVELSDMIVGDFLFVLPSAEDLSSARVYCTDGLYLYDLTDSCERLGTDLSLLSLSECDYYAVLRPSLEMASIYRTESFYEGETDVEKAIIATAKAYLLRGDRMQYADTRLVTSIQNYRWERGKAPEDYTTDETGYSNCTGFVHDVYLHALGWDYGDFLLKNAPEEMKAFVYYFTGNEKAAAQAELEESYLASLRGGDIVFYSYSTNNHAMLYIGNGNLVHCTGSTYNGYVEKEEPAIRLDSVKTLFDPTSSRYVFSEEKPRTALYIIRPLNTWQGSEIPEEAQNRIANMTGIFAEKTCSKTLGQTVNPGDSLTYTFTVFNSNPSAVTVNISDRIPDGTILRIEGKPSDQAELAWTLMLAPLEKRSVSYEVTVSELAEEGTAILCTDESRVGGIVTKATPVFIGRTLRAEEQEKVREATLKMVGSDMGSIALLNAIYKDALGIDSVINVSLSDLPYAIFPESGSLRSIAESGYYAEIIAPSQYGGSTVLDSERFLGERTRLTRERNLIVGDVLYLKGTSTYCLYIYLGDGVLLEISSGLKTKDIEERLEATLGWPMFVVLRPSLAFEQ